MNVFVYSYNTYMYIQIIVIYLFVQCKNDKYQQICTNTIFGDPHLRVAPLHPSPWPQRRNEAGPSSIPRWNIDQGYHQMSWCVTCQHQMQTKFVSKISLKLKSTSKIIIDHRGLHDSKRSFGLNDLFRMIRAFCWKLKGHTFWLLRWTRPNCWMALSACREWSVRSVAA